MPEIQWKYYVGRGPEIDDIISQNKKAWNDVLSARAALMQDYQANGLMPGDKHRYTVVGLLYYEKPAFDYMKYTLAQIKTPSTQRDFYKAVPNLRHADGKVLAEKLASPDVTFDPKNELVNLLGVNCVADFRASANQTSSSMVWSSVEQVEHLLLVRMPADASRQHILGRVPKVPKFLKLIRKDDYDALLKGDFSVL